MRNDVEASRSWWVGGYQNDEKYSLLKLLWGVPVTTDPNLLNHLVRHRVNRVRLEV